MNVRVHSHLVWYKQHSTQTIWAYCHYPANWLGMSDPLKPNSKAPWFTCFKALHLPVFWSRCKAILEFPAEVYANGWLNWTVGSDFLLPKYWGMIWLIFPSQLNSFSFYSFFQLFCPNYTLLLSSTMFLKWKKMKAWSQLMVNYQLKESIDQCLRSHSCVK